MRDRLWEEAVKFHGHSCPGLAIGFRAAEIALEKLEIKAARDEELICITENDACGVDAVQYLTGCTMGKGNLIYRGTGKMAFTFVDRQKERAVRIYLRPSSKMSRDEKIDYILNGEAEEVYKIEEVKPYLPEKARIFESISCQECGELAPEHKIRIEGGRKLCLDCSTSYTRGWD